MNKKIKSIFGVTLCAIFLATVLLFTACGAPKVYWNFSAPETEVDFHTEKQAAYLASSEYDTLEFVRGAEESLPEAVTFEWAATPEKEGLEVTGYTLEISRDSKFTEDTTLIYETTETSYDVYNLYVATDYYWRVTAKTKEGDATSPNQFFHTTDAGFRNIYVEGVTNMRDLGGWKTESGDRVKQGMIYRCGRLNIGNADGYVPDEYTENITAEGKKTMLEQLGIKSQIDLRRTDNNEVGYLPLAGNLGPLGEGVDYVQMPMQWEIGSENDSNNLVSANKDMVKKFFVYMADESHYPMIFHCNIGTDRTGALAYLINGLLGVTEEGLHRDYMLSNLGNITGARSITKITDTYGKMLDEYNGATLSEKIQNYLITEVGVTQAQIDTIKGLLIE